MAKTGFYEKSCERCGSLFRTNNRKQVLFCGASCRIAQKSDDDLARFNDRYIPEPNSGCWLWTHATFSVGMGYGNFKLNGHNQQAHRVSYQLFVGNIPNGLCVLHSCDNPICVNPSHLSLGTRAENLRQMVERGRSLTGERHPNSFLTENDIREMRSSYKGERGFYVRAAEKFGVTPTTVQRIIERKAWVHI